MGAWKYHELSLFASLTRAPSLLDPSRFISRRSLSASSSVVSTFGKRGRLLSLVSGALGAFLGHCVCNGDLWALRGVLAFCSELRIELVLLLIPMSGVTNSAHVPSFDGRASSFGTYDKEAISRGQISTPGTAKRAAN